jgi:ketosteroid isomerase-like protein
MSEQGNLKLVQQFYADFKTGNINGVLSTLADDVGWFIPGPKDIVPFVGQRQGREQVAQAIAEFAEKSVTLPGVFGHPGVGSRISHGSISVGQQNKQ